LKVKITLNMTVAKTVELPDTLCPKRLSPGSAELLDSLLEATPTLAAQWDTFQIHSERYTADGVEIHFGGVDRSILLSELFELAKEVDELVPEAGMHTRLEQLVCDADDQSGDAGKEERT